jgi:predicted SAM-dependent methyltransferase
MDDRARLRNESFGKLVAESNNKDCLQIGVRKARHAPNWISVDLYDRSDYIDYNYDIHDLKFEDEKFDVVVCNAILEHVENPARAIGELHRVLRKGGVIWVEVPFNQPYHPSPDDYWRVSLEGMRIWMKDFTEISAGFFRINKSRIYNGIFFFGRK